MEKSIEDLIKETKERMRDLIFTAVDYDENTRASAAGRVADHLIDELVKKLKSDGRPKIIHQYSDPSTNRPFINVSVDLNQE